MLITTKSSDFPPTIVISSAGSNLQQHNLVLTIAIHCYSCNVEVTFFQDFIEMFAMYVVSDIDTCMLTSHLLLCKRLIIQKSCLLF